MRAITRKLPFVNFARNVQQLQNRTIGDAIADRRTLASALDQALRAQHRQVLRNVWLLQFERVLKFGDGQWSLPKRI
jgi:hypothetical protein